MLKSIATIVVLFSVAQAMGDESYILANIEPGKPCPKGPSSTAGIACQRADCSFKYDLRAYWKTTVYGSPALDRCFTACNRHQQSCKVQCEHFADQDVYESSNICKCTRRASRDEVLGTCVEACKQGIGMCKGLCLNESKCRSKITTFGTWFKEYRGFCGVKCRERTLTVART